jgi:hypothetical protein
MVRISTCIVALLLVASAVTAQKKVNPKKYAETITAADASKILYVLAGAEMEGRETATYGQKKAAAFIENHFTTLGLLPGNNGSYQMQYPVFRDSLLSSQISVNGTNFNLNTDFQPILQMSSSSTQFFSEVVMVGHGIVDEGWNDYANLDVTGKAVLILDGTPEGYSSKKKGWRAPGGMYGKIGTATSKGAAAIIIVTPGFPRREITPLGNMYTKLFSPKQGGVVYNVSPAIAEKIVGDEWKTINKKAMVVGKTINAEVMLELNKKVQMLNSSNVLGYIEGTDKKDEWLIVTGHYDHLGKKGDVIYYGADDDGSGSTGVMEIAEAFAKAKADGKGPRRNVLFMTVSGEEKGLWGSEYFSDHPVMPLEKVTADLNIDMIGRIDTERKSGDTLNYIYVVGDDKLSTELKPLSEEVNNKTGKLTLDYKFNDPNDTEQIYFRSDHYNFARKGVPVIFYYDGMLKADYHKPTDTPDKISYDLLEKRARLVFYTAWEMANRETMMKRDLELPKMSRQ